MVTWRKDFDPSVVAARIEQSKTVANGKVSFSGFALAEHLPLLTGMLSLNSEIPDGEVQRIVLRAVSVAALAGTITANSIKEQVEGLERGRIQV